MSKKNKLLRVYCHTMGNLIINDVSQRLTIAQATELSPHHFEPNLLPCVPFEFDAIINGVRYEKLQGELKFGENRGQATVKIDFPDNADEQKWIDECSNKLQSMIFKQLG